MEKQLINPYEKEYMKTAMLKHEQTFKQQVYELHRLYQIQKILMKNIETNNGHSQEQWVISKYGTIGNQNQTIIHHDRDLQQKKPHRKLDLEQPAEEYIEDHLDCNGNGVLEIEDEREIELTLGPTSYNRRKQQKGDHQTPLTSESGPSSSSSTGSSHMKKTNSSSGTHQRTDNIRSSTRNELATCSQWGHVQSERRNSGVDVEEQLRQETLKQPPWIFQSLSLNMT